MTGLSTGAATGVVDRLERVGCVLADAAALPSAGRTAWQSLFEHAGLEAGQSVLINAAGDGVGGYGVQLARQAGATIIATATARSLDRGRCYGADQITGYTATPLVQVVAGHRFGVVLNLVRTSTEETAALAGPAADGGAFDRDDSAALHLAGRDQAGADRGVVEVHGAGTALALLAGALRAGQPHPLAKHIEQALAFPYVVGQHHHPGPEDRGRGLRTARVFERSNVADGNYALAGDGLVKAAVTRQLADAVRRTHTISVDIGDAEDAVLLLATVLAIEAARYERAGTHTNPRALLDLLNPLNWLNPQNPLSWP